ncbi:hypothetical protein TSOC_011955 [Tetrabaena socialis]|uniref:Ion transport domain-containing protein n=1 Tax=Tetrabaena socialis TaxID=47790 RepID=A0A2J7ZPB2_9CHLO|nr:hypothetical protein TSOC_011955 [Tetrabaena socialis]|eukprot:PNH02106.1 hypothetical protein TSOC_011955 [Tetrabaena socialis]
MLRKAFSARRDRAILVPWSSPRKISFSVSSDLSAAEGSLTTWISSLLMAPDTASKASANASARLMKSLSSPPPVPPPPYVYNDHPQENAHQYGGRLASYFNSGFNIVEAVCWLMLVASIGLKAAMWAVPDGQDNPLWSDLQTARDFIYNTASILVWARLLQYIVPLHEGMGSQLMVISQMFREVFKFAVPGTILLTGVTFALYAMFKCVLGSQVPLTPGGGEAEGAKEDRLALLRRVAAAVAEDDLEDLRKAVEAYGSRARAAPSAWPRPSFLTSSGVPLTTVAAQRNAQPRLVLYLAAQGGELDATGLKYVLASAKALQGGGYTDVRHFVLSYLFHQRNPIASAMVAAQVLLEAAAANSAKAKDWKDRGIPALATFPSTMLKLFRTFLGETMFDVFVDEQTEIYNLYGNIITLLYALVATVVLANLLIAIISFKYQPDKMAELLAHYEYMVDHHLIGAPFSAPQLLLRLALPSGCRQKGSSSWLAETFSLSPMDGIVVSGENTESKFLPTGSSELPAQRQFLCARVLTRVEVARALRHAGFKRSEVAAAAGGALTPAEAAAGPRGRPKQPSASASGALAAPPAPGGWTRDGASLLPYAHSDSSSSGGASGSDDDVDLATIGAAARPRVSAASRRQPSYSGGAAGMAAVQEAAAVLPFGPGGFGGGGGASGGGLDDAKAALAKAARRVARKVGAELRQSVMAGLKGEVMEAVRAAAAGLGGGGGMGGSSASGIPARTRSPLPMHLIWPRPAPTPLLAGENTESKFLPTGSSELPYLVYLLTFYPAALALSWAIYFGMAPYCIAHFALIGYRKWTGGDKRSLSAEPTYTKRHTRSLLRFWLASYSISKDIAAV